MKRLLIISTVFFFSMVAPVSAQEVTIDPTSTTSTSLSTTPVITMENTEIQYDLPYPGILPDNPLYFLKVIRDKVQEFFITDPMQKAVFYVNQADKRMNASIYLSEEKSSKDMVISATVSKALNYYEQAISQIRQAQQRGQDVQSFIHHMDTASQKYHQLLLQLQTRAKPSLKADLEGDKRRVDALHQSVVAMEKH